MNGPAWWVGGKTGSLAPWAQAKVWALLEVSKERDLKLSQDSIAKSVTKVGGGNPSQAAISQIKDAIEKDPEWYPGKTTAEAKKRGPKPTLTPQKQQAIANAAMAMKRRGEEPTAPDLKRRCPDATFNPGTGHPVTDKYIYPVLKSKCVDDGYEKPWGHLHPNRKTALAPKQKAWRVKFARAEMRLGRPAEWYHRNVIYVDPCHTILSDRPRSTFDEKQASYGKSKRWMSPDAKSTSRNLMASPYATKQTQFGDRKIWWFIVLFRGKVHYEIMGSDWKQTGAGVAQMVARLERILRANLKDGTPLPRVVLSDRGPGLYQASTGHIVGDYFNALKHHGFRAYAGADASNQPPDMPDVFPHETAVAWTRHYLKKYPLTKGTGLPAMEMELAARLKECKTYINRNLEVGDLCSSYPTRMKELIDAEGERLNH